MSPKNTDFAWKWSWKPVELPKEIADELALRFEASVYEEAIRDTRWTDASTAEIELLVSLGNIYSRLRLLREGLRVDQRLVALRPDEPIFFYNLACSHSLLGEIDDAFRALQRSVELGYQNFEHLRLDSDLENLRADERYHAILRQLESSR